MLTFNTSWSPSFNFNLPLLHVYDALPVYHLSISWTAPSCSVLTPYVMYSVGPGRGSVLAEDFFAPTYLRMQLAFLRQV